MNSEIRASLTTPVQDPRRAAILCSARRPFMSSGYAATRMEPIAREAAVSTATLYAYFPSKEDLFAAVIIDAADEFERQMHNVGAGAGPARVRLTEFMMAYAGFMGDPFVRSVFRLVMAERPRFRDVAMRFFDRGRSDFGRPLMTALTELQATGELKIDKPSWAAGQLMGMIEHPVFFMPLVTGDEVQATRSVEQIVNDAIETFMARYGAK
ncbi:MAG TPA: TetR/AcrR family transcriptional regulator [Brevundimonas sp.]